MGLTSLQPLRHRSFALALSSNFVSSIGGWMQSVALGVYLQTTTHNAVWLGLVTLSGWAPAIVASPLGGVWADRFRRQRLIQVSNVIMASCAIVLAVALALHHLSPWLAVAMALVEGFSGQASWASWNSLLRDLVEPSDVVSAVSLSSAQFNLGRIIGPVVAGVLLTAGSPVWCFAANAASFVLVVIVFAFVRSRPREERVTHASMWRATRHAARVAWTVPGSRNAIIAVGIVAFFASPFITLVPTMAIEILHGHAGATSTLVTAQGVGAVAAAFLLPSVARRTSRVAVIRGSLACLVAGLVVYGAAPTVAVAAGALVLVGAAYLGCLTQFNSSVQLSAPTSERSRILSLYTLSLSVWYPVGALLQSALVRVIGLRTVTEVATAALAVTLVLVRWRWPTALHALGGHEPAERTTDA
jgi:MFS family permease